jgi:hypothetical protein
MLDVAMTYGISLYRPIAYGHGPTARAKLARSKLASSMLYVVALRGAELLSRGQLQCQQRRDHVALQLRGHAMLAAEGVAAALRAHYRVCQCISQPRFRSLPSALPEALSPRTTRARSALRRRSSHHHASSSACRGRSGLPRSLSLYSRNITATRYSLCAHHRPRDGRLELLFCAPALAQLSPTALHDAPGRRHNRPHLTVVHVPSTFTTGYNKVYTTPFPRNRSVAADHIN